MTNQPSSNLWKLNVNEVQKALESLCRAKIHPAFAGYLCLKWTARISGASTELRPNFRNFFDSFLAVPGGPANKPYVLPFVAQGAGKLNIWFNANVAGSYAPSSIRPQSPMRQVCSFSGSRNDTTFELLEKHAEGAKAAMLFGGLLSVEALCIFLYRNYSLVGENPVGEDLVNLFREEFGFREHISHENEEYLHLFVNNGMNSQDLFEIV